MSKARLWSSSRSGLSDTRLGLGLSARRREDRQEMLSALKTCTKCRRQLPVSAFGKDKRSISGLRWCCKSCDNARARESYRTNGRKSYNPRPAYDKARQRSPEYIARLRVRDAVRRGRIQKPSACEDCGAPTEASLLQGHHEGYARPLHVVWLCSKCHGVRHRIEKGEAA